MVQWTDSPISAVELCSSFNVIFGLFVASLINALLAWSVSFCGRPSLGRFIVVPYSFHFLIMNLMVLGGMFKVSDIFLQPNPDLYFSTTFFPDLFGELLGLHGAAFLVVLQTLGPFRAAVQCLAKVFGPLELCDLLPHFRLQT